VPARNEATSSKQCRGYAEVRGTAARRWRAAQQQVAISAPRLRMLQAWSRKRSRAARHGSGCLAGCGG